MTYSQKLRDPRWQKKRLHILERDKWTCCSCQSTTKNLQVHHLIYRKVDPWDYDDAHLQTLCDECHQTRQLVADNMANFLKLSLARLSLSELDEYDTHFTSNPGIGDPFSEKIASTMNHVLELAKEGVSPIHFDLTLRLLQSLFIVSMVPTRQNADKLDEAMSMVSEKLEVIK